MTSTVISPVRRVLVLGGGDIGSAIAHRLFGLGVRVVLCERPQSPHARRGMAFTDALFEGSATLAGVRARCVPDVKALEACWSEGAAIPIVTIPEDLLAAQVAFDACVEATMRRHQQPPDIRHLAPIAIGLGPGYLPGINCHAAIETQWGLRMGEVLETEPTAARSGGPRPLAGITRERFAVVPEAGTWRTHARLGQSVEAGEVVGNLDGREIRAPIAGHLRGLTYDGAQVRAGARTVEVDPRTPPQVFGLGERPVAVAEGIVRVLKLADAAAMAPP